MSDPPIHDSLRCPSCGAYMETGAISVSTGLNWLRVHHDRPADMAEAVPGTHSVMRANHLVAWRCKKCRLITARYGEPLERHRKMNEAVADNA